MTNEEKQLMGQGLKKIIEVYNLLEQGGHGFLHHIASKTSTRRKPYKPTTRRN